jgi:hypothetical protein
MFLSDLEFPEGNFPANLFFPCFFKALAIDP